MRYLIAVTGVLRVIARMRASSVSGITASSEAAKGFHPEQLRDLVYQPAHCATSPQ